MGSFEKQVSSVADDTVAPPGSETLSEAAPSADLPKGPVPDKKTRVKSGKKLQPKQTAQKKCPHCSYETSLSNRMKIHMNQHTKGTEEKQVSEQCPFCHEFQTCWRREM